MEPTWQEIEQAFTRATDLAGEDRNAYLSRLRQDQPALYARVDALLLADARDDEVLHQPIRNSAQDLADLDDDRWQGRQVGVYRITGRIASGGMGAVFLADRIDETYQQQVALKIMSAHLLQSDAISRFRAERQILANLAHPNVAQLLDGGTTDEGLPYLVMEYIQGEPINIYCERQRLSVSERLALFTQVCDAVDYAHRNLVVHRDIKPSNILVTDAGEVKLLDFGIAKLIDVDASADLTQVGTRAMTLDFASPEQVRGDTISVGSDVYALGVLLYHLLTGHSPYKTTNANIRNLESSILQEEPRKPSVVLTSGSTSKLDMDSANSNPFSLDPARVSRQLSGDLDNIVLMAIRKEVDQRYASVEAFKQDIENYLGNRPVNAHRASIVYRAAKFLRRNATAASLAAASVLAIIGITAAFTYQLAQERDIAQTERKVAEQVTEFVTDVFRTADPYENQGDDLTVRQALDQATSTLDEQLNESPALKARILHVLGSVYYGLGFYEQTQSLTRQSLALQEGDTMTPKQLETKELLADATVYLSEYDEAIELLTTLVAQRSDLLGPQHNKTINAVASLGDVYGRTGDPARQLAFCEPYLEDARALTQVAEKTWLLVCVATALDLLNQDERSLEIYEEVAALQKAAWGEEDLTYLLTLNNLALAQPKTTEGLANSIALLTQVIETRRRVLDPKHPQLVEALHNRANIYLNNSLFTEAQSDVDEALQIVGTYPPNSGDLHIWLEILAARLDEVNSKYDAAEARYKTVIDSITQHSDGANLWLAKTYAGLGKVLGITQRYDEALEWYRLSKLEFEKAYGTNHIEVIYSVLGTLSILLQSGDTEKATQMAWDAIDQANKLGNERAIFETMVVTNKVFLKAEKFEDVLQSTRASRASAEKFFGNPSPEYGVFLSNLADAEAGIGDHNNSIETRELAIAQLGAAVGDDHPVVAVQKMGMAKSLRATGRDESAIEQAQSALATLTQYLGEDHPASITAREFIDAQ
ncbi:MAG: serine/threonine-protein kinase [Pseudomonadota bacterium]